MSILIRLRRDDGAVAVVVALLMVVLLGFAAISIDVGANYAERRQLQNGADAAALAVALDSGCRGATTAANTGTAVDLAQRNVNNGLAQASAANDPNARTVTATTWVVDGTGAPGRHNWFAPVLGVDTTQISASATVGCGSPTGGMATLPITFRDCLFTDQARLTPTLFRNDNGATDCASGRVGTVVPGGFGRLDSTDGGCGTMVSIADPIGASNPGKSFPGCDGVLQQLRKGNQVLLIPIYDTATGQGSGASFHIIGFAALKVTGYRFPAGGSWNNNEKGAPSCTGNCSGIIGTFVTLVNLDNNYTMGDTDFGVTSVRLTK